MALQIARPTRFGRDQVATYHRVTAVELHPAARCAIVTVQGFADREHRLGTDARPLLKQKFRIAGEDYRRAFETGLGRLGDGVRLADLLTAAAYAALRRLRSGHEDLFAAAEDV